MDINAIKSGFVNYLNELKGAGKKSNKNLKASDVSIFANFKDFKEYLHDEFNLSSDVLYMSMEDLKDLEINNGKLVNPNEDSESSKNNEDISMLDVFNLLLEDEEFMSEFDKNGNGKIDDKEFSTFTKDINKLNADDEQVSMDDILKLSKDIDSKNAKEKAAEKNKNAENAKSASASNSGGMGNVPTSGYSPSPAAASTPTNSSSTPDAATGLDGMSLEELESEKTTREGNVSDAQEELNAVYSGDNEQVKEAKEQEEQAKNDYTEVVENDESISDELKEALSDKLNEISDQENTIDELKISLNDANNEVTQQEQVVANDEATISSIEDTISSLSSQTSDDPEVQQEIEANIAELERQKNEAIAKRDDDKATLEDELIPKRDDIENTQIPEAEEQLQTLEEEKEKIDEEILKTCSPEAKEAIETALKAYDEARENVQTVQESELAEAQQNLDTANADLKEINEKINEKKAEELKSEYSVAPDGKEVLKRLEEAGGDAYEGFDKLCSALGMSREEAAQYMSDLCTSPEWGDGCIDPVIFIAQICQESGFRPDALGDQERAVGLGQLWEICVREVNQYNGKNYTYEDRWDAKKNLEMAILYLKEGYDQTGDYRLALGFYNQGSVEGAKSANGQAYIDAVLGRLDHVPA